MLIGYARVSTDDQTLNPQIDALKSAGCEKIFTDVASGAKTERPGLKQALEFCRSDDILIVWKLDRMGRSMSHLIKTIQMLEQKQTGFQSLTEKIDTTTAGGRLIFHVFGALAEFERELIRERVKAGLKSARSRGRKGGRPSLSKQTKNMIATLACNKDLSVKQICEKLNIGKSTFYKYAKITDDFI
ncbi:MAG: recombinase family protein [Deltaproteobacteria bacterium]|nr:recombinase family protein [Deltaproteobacteria bacterium]